MKRLWTGLRVMWRWYTGPARETVTPGPLTRESADYLRALLDEPAFQTAIGQVVAAEAEVERGYLRQWVRVGNHLEAARAEGMLSVMEDLPSILQGYANKFQAPTAAPQ